MSDHRPSIISTPGFALTAAEQMSTALWRNAIDSSFTQPQFLTLCGVGHNPGIGHYNLADRVGIDRATLGPILKKMSDQQLIDRSSDPKDSRRSVLALTGRGAEMLAEMVPDVESVNRLLMSPLNPAEQAALVQSWAIMAGEMLQRPEEDEETALSHMPSLRQYPWFFLRQACRQYRRLWREQVDENINSSLFALMDVVNHAPHIDIRTAALRASVEESNAVRMVMRLVRTHMMRDPRDPQDARRSLLSLTATGQQVHEQLTTRSRKAQRSLIQHLPPVAVTEFHRLTSKVARLNSAESGQPAGDMLW